MSESKLRDKVRSWLKKTYPKGYYIKFNDRLTSGIPDLIFIKEGRHIWIELKYGKNKCSWIQESEFERMRDAGAEVYVCYSLDDVKKVIKGE